MSEYLMCIVVAGVVGALCTVLIPDREETVKKSVSVATAVCIFFCVISPLPQFIEAVPELFGVETDAAWEAEAWQILASAGREAAERGIEETIKREFGLSGGVTVLADVSVGEEGFCLERVVVRLTGSSVFADAREIKKYIEQNAGCECEVKLGGER